MAKHRKAKDCAKKYLCFVILELSLEELNTIHAWAGVWNFESVQFFPQQKLFRFLAQKNLLTF